METQFSSLVLNQETLMNAELEQDSPLDSVRIQKKRHL